MRLLEIIQRVRALTRDFSHSIFREQDIIDFINEGVNRFKQVIPELKPTPKLIEKNQKPFPIPEHYHHLLAVYSASRCFGQDERHYQATNMMNEFEIKLDELKEGIYSGDIELINPETGEPIEVMNDTDYVDLYPYWGVKGRDR